MIWLAVFLFLTDPQSVTLAKVPSAILEDAEACLNLGSDGSILAGGRQKLFHWEPNGSLRRILDLPADPSFCAFLDNLYIVTLSEPERKTLYFDRRGQPVSVADHSVIDDLHLVGTTMFMTNLDEAQLKRNPFRYLAREISLRPLETGWTLQRTDFMFVKASEKQREMYFRFPRIFLVKAQSSSLRYAAMNQLENKVYLYDQNVLAQEREQGQRIASTAPSVSLRLTDYSDRPKAMYHPGLIERDDPKNVDRERAWRNGLGLVQGFEAWQDGYLVIYEVPQYDTSKQCHSYKLATQCLTRNFSRTGQMKLWEGIAIGVVGYASGDQLLVLFQMPTNQHPARVMRVSP